ncbi:MAG: hypothetical protein ACYCYF_08070 [Anaerolineae bacterium]
MRIRILVLVILLALLVAPLMGCGSKDDAENPNAVEDVQGSEDTGDTGDDQEPESSASDEDTDEAEADDTDDEAEAAPDVATLDTLDSYRQSMTTRVVSGDEVTEWTILTEFVREPRAQRMVWSSVDAEGNQTESWETIQIGTTTYMRGDEASGGSAEWVSYSSEDAEEPEGSADITNWMNAANYLEDPNCKRQGREDVDGQNAVLYVCDEGVFGAYGGVWGVTGKLIEASIQTWVSDEYDVPLRSITEWVGEDDDKVRHEYFSEGIITDINEPITIEPPEGVDKPGLPEDVPLYPDAKITLAMAGMVGFEVDAALPDVIAFYKEEMVAQGWALDTDGGEMLSFSKEGRSATVMMSASDATVSGSIIVQ